MANLRGFALLVPVALGALGLLGADRSLAAAPGPLEGLRFLLGDWVADAAGPHQASPGTSSFRAELGGAVLVRRDHVEARGADGKVAALDMLMTLYADGGSLRADYFDAEGHVIHYGAKEVEPGKSLQLVSLPGPGPSFRLTYTALDAHRVNVRFEMAPPGPVTHFKVYTEGAMHKR